MQKKNIEIIYILYLLITVNIFANDSVYTVAKTTECKLLEEDDRSAEYLCSSAKGYKFKVLDTGGPLIEFSVEKAEQSYNMFSNQEAKVVEWRLDDKKNAIGLIVRVYEYVETADLTNSKSTSKLNVISLVNEPMLLKTTKSNSEARTIIDNYFKNSVK
jgi:hypothetical protein